MRTTIFRFALVVFGAHLSGCTGLLYHPTRQIYVSPEQVEASPKDIWIASRSGGTIHAWYFKSELAERSKGLILYFHGNGENISSYYLNLLWITPTGYDFVVFDYRGYGDSRFADGNRRITPESTVEDGLDAIEWTENFSKDNRVPYGIYAQSLGGAVGLRSIEEWTQSRSTQDFHAKIVFLDSTFGSYWEASRRILSTSVLTYLFQPLADVLIDNSKAPDRLLRALPAIPYVVIHGNQDQTVAYPLGRELYSELPKPKEFWHVEGGYHTDVFRGHALQFRRKFIKRLNCAFQSVCNDEQDEYVWHPDQPVVPNWTFTYGLPYAIHRKFEVLQGFDGSFSHTGEMRYSIDFRMPEGTPICAVRSGMVVYVRDASERGGPNSKFLNDANFIVVQHRDGTFAEYYHLKKSSHRVVAGQHVGKGDVLAESGDTGFSTEPHLHVMVYVKNNDGTKHSIPIVFDTEEEPAIRLEEGESYTRF